MVRSPAETRLTRRSLTSGAAAGLNAASTMNASAQQNSPAKGPAVWLDLDQKQLDDAYDQIKYAPNRPQVVGRYRTNSDLMRARIHAVIQRDAMAPFRTVPVVRAELGDNAGLVGAAMLALDGAERGGRPSDADGLHP